MSLDSKTSLRVLYTINASLQYILARSHTRVPVTVISPTENNGSQNTSKTPLYANVLLKTCLDTIRRSSPELTHDRNRDFSIYVLDPLESNSAPALVQISDAGNESTSPNNTSTAEQPKGIAVGLGLMSWALAADDSDAMTVTGTLVKQANGQEALEVIFALRETVTMQKPAWNVQPNPLQPSTSQERLRKPKTEMPPQYPFLSQSLDSPSSIQASANILTQENLASTQTRTKPKVKPHKPAKQSATPVTESDKLMNADTYIGPQKKKGRPKTIGGDNKATVNHINVAVSGAGLNFSSHPKEVIVIDGSDSDGTEPASTAMKLPMSNKSIDKPCVSDKSSKKCSKQFPVNSPFTTEPLVKRATIPGPTATLAPLNAVQTRLEVKTEPQEESTLLGLLSYLSATSSSEPTAQNAAILAALNAIDSSGKPQENVPNPALIAALRQLLTVPSIPSPTPLNTEIPRPHHSSTSSQDESIVNLDKENVNPVVYQKKSEKEYQALKSSDPSFAIASSSSMSPSVQPSNHTERNVQSLGPSARPNGKSLKHSLTDSSLGNSSGKSVRKRTLSDFMDERENRTKGKGKERERVEKRDGHRHAQLQRTQQPRSTSMGDALRHYPRLAVSSLPRTESGGNNYYRLPLESGAMTSPVRPRPDLEDRLSLHENFGAENSRGSSIRLSSISPRRPKVSASSPVRGPKNESRKKYVIPEWARTDTATQPRLSEEARKALEEAEERKKRERSAARKKMPSVQAKLKNKGAAIPSDTDGMGHNQLRPLAPPPPPELDASRGPIAAKDCPMIAAVDITFPFVCSTRASSPTPQPNAAAPKTPSRDIRHPRITPSAENDSLFTPVIGSGSLFGSARSYARQTPLPLPSVLTSPLGNRKKARLTPARSNLTGRAFSVPAAWNTSSSAPSSDTKTEDEGDRSSKSLGRELHNALEDLECPPNSLPIASSDIDVDEGHTGPSRDGELDTGDESDFVPVKQHWAGLPPSSPPPPSSPTLLPEVVDNDDDDMTELPIATSDSETDTEMDLSTRGDAGNATSSEDIHSPVDVANDVDAQVDFPTFFTPQNFSTASEFPNSSELFEQYTNINDQSDVFAGMSEFNMSDSNLGAVFQNGLEDIDFTEFWETFKPMVNGSVQISQMLSDHLAFGTRQDDPVSMSFGEVDHSKLADEVQSLFSGCLM